MPSLSLRLCICVWWAVGCAYALDVAQTHCINLTKDVFHLYATREYSECVVRYSISLIEPSIENSADFVQLNTYNKAIFRYLNICAKRQYNNIYTYVN